MSEGQSGDGSGKGGPSTLKGQPAQPGFDAHHGGLSDEQRRELESLQTAEQTSVPIQEAHAGQTQPFGSPHAPVPAQAPGEQQQPSPHYAPQQQHPQQQYAGQQQQHVAQQQAAQPYGSPQHHVAAGANQPVAGHTPAQGQLPLAQIGNVEQTPLSGNPIIIAITRAFRSSIHPDEVTEMERTSLLGASPSVEDPYMQGFLAWRRSLLIVVAALLAPISILKIVEFTDLGDQLPDTIKSMFMLRLIVDVAFAVAIWFLVPLWTQWRRQRRLLVTLWFVYFATPFLVFLYPWRAAAEGGDPQQLISLGAVAAIYAMVSLGPKAISLMPGLMRGAIAVKQLLPGSSAPGWLLTLSAPIYALFFYLLLILPYQMSGSGFFVGAMLGFTGAQVWMARMGYRLARPESKEQATQTIRKVRVGFHVLNGFGALMLVIAFIDFAEKLDFSAAGVIEIFVSFAANVLLLTIIATDLLLANLYRAATISSDPSTHRAQQEFFSAVAHFASPTIDSPPSAQQDQHHGQ